MLRLDEMEEEQKMEIYERDAAKEELRMERRNVSE